MPTRTRSRDLRSPISGTYWYYVGGTTTRSRDIGLLENCVDTTGNFPNANAFDHYTVENSVPTLSGVQYSQSGTKLRELTKFPLAWNPSPPDPRAKFPVPNFVQLSALAWEILAKTNVSAPHVNVPAALGEMKDLPDLIRDWGGSLLKKVAKGHLSWRWAIKPMISDIRKMYAFTDAVNQRLRWLYKLRDGKTIRRRCVLSTSTISDPWSSEGNFHTEGATIRGKSRKTYTSKVWGSAQWKLEPGTDIPNLGALPLKHLANMATFGLNIESYGGLAAAWELTPWSWFIDWFSNVGTVMAATNNTIPCTWDSNLCLMRTITGHTEYQINPATSSTWVTVSGDYHYERMVRKERYVVAPTLPVSLSYLPMLDSGKWSILGSLAALKLRL